MLKKLKVEQIVPVLAGVTNTEVVFKINQIVAAHNNLVDYLIKKEEEAKNAKTGN